MEALIRNGLVFGALLVLALVGWRSKWRLPAVGLALLIGVPVAIRLEVLGPGWAAGSPVPDLGLLAAWVVFTRLAAAAGGPALRGPAWLIAPLLGGLVGDWGAALLLAPLAPSPSVGGRWILGAMAGGLLLPHGTPSVLLIADPAAFGILPLLLWAIAGPPGRIDHTGSNTVTAYVLVVALCAWLLPGLMMPVLGICAAALAVHSGLPEAREPVRGLLSLALLAGVVWLARHSGALNELRWVLDQALVMGGSLGPAALTLGAAVAAAVAGEISLALATSGALDTVVALDQPAVRPAIAAGLAVGGLGPLLLGRCLNETALRWGLGVAAAVSWSAWTLP